MKTLHLNLKRKWFNMILSGEKKEEYRDMKPYYVSRLINFKQETEFEVVDEFTTDLKWSYNRHHSPDALMDYFNAEFKEFDNILFVNGYRKDSLRFYTVFKRIEIKPGNKAWGAVPGKYYFSIKLGDVWK